MGGGKLNVENMQPNILYYSKQCVHCKRFRQMLMKKPDLESTFIQLCVDTGGKLPPYVKSVPFIVVHDSKGQTLKLTDGDAFQWLNVKMEELAGDFEAYDGGVMSSSIGGTYAYISENGVCQTPTTGQFEWINNEEKPFLGSFGDTINTPNEASFGGGRDKPPKSDLDRIMEQRNKDLPNHQKPAQIDFSKPFHLQGGQQQHGGQQQQPKVNEASYAVDARKRDTRIAAPQRGVDFQNPRFAQQQQQQQQQQRKPVQQSPFQRPAPNIGGRVLPKQPVNQPIHRAPSGPPQGRVMPQSFRR